MALYLYELVPATGTATPEPSEVEAIIKRLDTRVRAGGGELIETQVTQGATQVFAVAEFDQSAAAYAAEAVGAATVPGPEEVRLVGADLAGADKCLCFYNAPDEAAVLRARDAVSTPVDRIHRLQD